MLLTLRMILWRKKVIPFRVFTKIYPLQYAWQDKLQLLVIYLNIKCLWSFEWVKNGDITTHLPQSRVCHYTCNPLMINFAICKILHRCMHTATDKEQSICPHTYHSWYKVPVLACLSLNACPFKTQSANPLPFCSSHMQHHSIHTPTDFSGLTSIHSEQLCHCPLIPFGWIL